MSAEHDLSCVVHVHSTFSDGTATVPEVVEAARGAGRDAVLLTDHDTMEARARGLEGWHGSVLLVVGVEISPPGGHLLAFGLEQELDHEGSAEPEIVRRASEAGALTFAAHPFSAGSRISRRIGRPHPWPGLGSDELTGIELWSLVTDAAEGWRGPREAISFLRDPLRALDGPPAGGLDTWDRLCTRRRTVALGGLDAHQSGLRLRGRVLSPMPHRRYFGLLGTHVILDRPPSGDDEIDVAALLASLREGRCYLAVDALAEPHGFDFRAENGLRQLPMGAEASAGEWTLRTRAPRTSELRILRDGRTIAREEGTALELAVADPGVYRVEARLRSDGRDRLWIISNPIYLRGQT